VNIINNTLPGKDYINSTLPRIIYTGNGKSNFNMKEEHIILYHIILYKYFYVPSHTKILIFVLSGIKRTDTVEKPINLSPLPLKSIL